jgi:hypothetical protein
VWSLAPTHLEAGAFEQPRHAFTAHREAGLAQIAVNPQRAIRPARRTVELPDPLEQPPVLDRPTTAAARPPHKVTMEWAA